VDTFSIIRNAIARSEAERAARVADLAYGLDGFNADAVEQAHIIAAVQVVVDVLTPPDGGRYIVGFADITTAATNLGDRKIIVSSKPLKDASLSTVEKAVVIATFAAHEIGHTYVTKPRKELIAAHNPKSGYHAVANLADDIILEPFMIDWAPILTDAFAFTGQWVLRTTGGPLPKRVAMKRDMTTAERFNVLISATRYGDITDIVWAPNAESERDWARGWSARLIDARLSDHATFLALCDEAWARVRSEPDVEDEVEEPPIIDEPEGEPTDDEPEGEDEDEPPVTDGPTEPTDDEPQGEDEDEPQGPGGEDEDEEPTDEPGDDETDEPPTSGPDGGVKGQPDEDGPISDPADQPRDWDEDGEDEDGEPEPDGDDEPGPDTGDSKSPDTREGKAGGGGDATSEDHPVRDEDSLDPKEIEKTSHDQVARDPSDWDASRIEQTIREYASTDTTSFGVHGAAPTTWS